VPDAPTVTAMGWSGALGERDRDQVQDYLARVRTRGAAVRELADLLTLGATRRGLAGRGELRSAV